MKFSLGIIGQTLSSDIITAQSSFAEADLHPEIRKYYEQHDKDPENDPKLQTGEDPNVAFFMGYANSVFTKRNGAVKDKAITQTAVFMKSLGFTDGDEIFENTLKELRSKYKQHGVADYIKPTHSDHDHFGPDEDVDINDIPMNSPMMYELVERFRFTYDKKTHTLYVGKIKLGTIPPQIIKYYKGKSLKDIKPIINPDGTVMLMGNKIGKIPVNVVSAMKSFILANKDRVKHVLFPNGDIQVVGFTGVKDIDLVMRPSDDKLSKYDVFINSIKPDRDFTSTDEKVDFAFEEAKKAFPGKYKRGGKLTKLPRVQRWNKRRVKNSDKWSEHAYGRAIDIMVDEVDGVYDVEQGNVAVKWAQRLPGVVYILFNGVKYKASNNFKPEKIFDNSHNDHVHIGWGSTGGTLMR
jgi:hypothetical protein